MQEKSKIENRSEVPMEQAIGEAKKDLESAMLEAALPPKSEEVEVLKELLQETPTVPVESVVSFRETVVSINRVTKVVSGGKRMAFSAVAVVGDGKGKVGSGKGKARDVPLAIAKASYQAKKHLVSVSLNGSTIPFAVVGNFGAGKVMLRPAAPGTGVVAGGTIRAVLEACGIRDVLTKNLGSSNVHSVLCATLDALQQLKTKEDIAKKRGKKVEDLQ